jgi:hypothetical protein
MLTVGPLDHFPRWRRSRRRLSVCSVLRCPDMWLVQREFRARFKKDAHHTRIMFLKSCTTLTLHCNHRSAHHQNRAHGKPYPAATPSWKKVPRPRSEIEKQTACSAGEAWIVPAADSVCCARVGWKKIFYQLLKPHHSFMYAQMYVILKTLWTNPPQFTTTMQTGFVEPR